MKWSDTTRRFKGEDKGSEARQLTLTVSLKHAFDIIIYKSELSPAHKWALCCYALHIDGHLLNATDVIAAQKEAISAVKQKLYAMKDCLDAVS